MAAVGLSKGANVSLTAAAPDLREVVVGLGWELRPGGDASPDVDASALGCDPDSRVVSDAWFVFFNNQRSPDGEIQHLGATRPGAGGGDAQQILVALGALPGDVDRVVFVVSLYDAERVGADFGAVERAHIRVVDRADGAELARYELPGDASTETAMVFGEVYRNAGEWKFRAIGQGYESGLAGIARDFGVDVA